MSGSDETSPSGWSPNTMTPAQCRAARGLVDWSAAGLAGKVGVDEKLVSDFEAGYGNPPSGIVEAMRSALMRAGVIFTEGDSPGVRPGRRGGDEGTRLGDLTTENDR